MRYGHNHLYVPGPTNVPHSVLSAMHVPMEDHRASDLHELTKPLFADLNKVFKTTKGQSFIFPATGTAGWEVALTNTLSPGDKVLSARFGQFSHLWINMAERLKLDVDFLKVPWGEGAPVPDIEKKLAEDKNHAINAVMIVHNETATGVTSEIAAVRKSLDATKHPAMLFVDGVSSIASIDFRMDEWGVDMAIAGSQKGFMLPAGLAIVCASQKALEARKTAKLPRCFLDLEDHIKTNANGLFPYTPSVPMLRGLRASLDLLFEEGLENVYARHHRLGEGVRQAIQAWGLKLCARQPKWYSDTVSAIMVPEGINGADVVDIAYRKYNTALGAGLTDVAGKLFRIGHLGDLNEVSCCAALAATEMAMLDVGIEIEAGSGLAAAIEYYRKNAPAADKKSTAGQARAMKSGSDMKQTA
ncbi:MAG: aminotransferase class V-fold PLP-dependent enzyme [Gammaproteobacteria bacterium]|nr:aminotransferase class V-fold PLP-dependent enzyme [Gammaproteobacteria bacterium]